MRITVFSEVSFYKLLFASACFQADSIDPIRIAIGFNLGQTTGIKISESPMLSGEKIGQDCLERDFDDSERKERDIPQFLVEVDDGLYGLEIGSFTESVTVAPEHVEIARQSIVVEVGEKSLDVALVAEESSTLQELTLIAGGKGWFLILHSKPDAGQKKRPPELRMQCRGAAGSLYIEYSTKL